MFTFFFVSTNSVLCFCNRPKQEHLHPNDELTVPWNSNVHIVKDPTKEQGVSLVNGAPV